MNFNKRTNKVQFLIFIVAIFFTVIVSCAEETVDTAQYTRATYSLEMVDGKVVSDKDWVKCIYKKDGENFVILNLTDIQLGTTSYLVSYKENFAMIDRVIKQAKPDLITVTGDFSYGCSVGFYGICSFIDSYGIPWAPVYGNHDFGNSDIDAKEEADILKHYSNCLFADGPRYLAFDSESGMEAFGNYVVNIVELKNDGFEVVKSLIMMNSTQNGIKELQVQWYEDCIDSLKAFDGSKTSAVFLHIPIYGFTEANKAAFKNSNVSVADSYNPDKKSEVWNKDYKDSFGVVGSWYGPSKDSYKFTKKIKDKASTDLVVCGHFHSNCSCIKYKGITYLYGLKTGSGYSYDENMCGGTSITVKDNGEFTVEHIFKKLDYSL